MKPRWHASTACLALVLTGCAREQPPAPQSAAASLGAAQVGTVNGEPIPESLFRYYVINVQRKDPNALSESERTQAIEELVQLKLLEAEARARGLLNERTIAAELELQRIQLVARRMALRYLEQAPATEAELRAMYNRNLPQLALTEYKARHILVDSEEEAIEAIRQLEGGAEFIALAQEISSGPTGANGGDLGWLTAESMVQPIAEAISSMQPGSYSTEPVRTDFGFHVLLLEDVRQQEPPTLESIRAELAAAVDREKLEAYLAEMREGAAVSTDTAIPQ